MNKKSSNMYLICVIPLFLKTNNNNFGLRMNNKKRQEKVFNNKMGNST